MKKFKKDRKMKVYEATTASRRNWYTSTRYTTVPQIRLQGLWLEQLGFKPGMELKVECEDGRLQITISKEIAVE